jgi:cell wall-associated NlpC family hydrolase
MLMTPEEGGRIVTVAKRWKDTPYLKEGKSRAGADCSGSVWAIYAEAGFPYQYCWTAIFPTSPRFKPSPQNIPQVGDVAWWNGHMAIYDPNAGVVDKQVAKLWSASHPGGRDFGPTPIEWFTKKYGPVTWYRYDKPIK